MGTRMKRVAKRSCAWIAWVALIGTMPGEASATQSWEELLEEAKNSLDAAARTEEEAQRRHVVQAVEKVEEALEKAASELRQHQVLERIAALEARAEVATPQRGAEWDRIEARMAEIAAQQERFEKEVRARMDRLEAQMRERTQEPAQEPQEVAAEPRDEESMEIALALAEAHLEKGVLSETAAGQYGRLGTAMSRCVAHARKRGVEGFADFVEVVHLTANAMATLTAARLQFALGLQQAAVYMEYSVAEQADLQAEIELMADGDDMLRNSIAGTRQLAEEAKEKNCDEMIGVEKNGTQWAKIAANLRQDMAPLEGRARALDRMKEALDEMLEARNRGT